ncbi:GAF domain-containing hybrid sensor histidine kinase/response regulator [Bryobacter aggregatus]|uniref:GAF domain-containing hybrid sensor histidine kinase/response regulator n=1 Tax=Bryobacter aggregatus TaxID=360054 RepID=UPI0004E26A2A|nr:GAF domain-containing hybrid sensor histidine kinase/response regulator [Bryobacter aggregatus]
MQPEGAAQEAQRLEELSAYRVLDTAPDSEFDAITELAARLCGVPSAFISLLGEKWITMLSAHGWDGVRELERGGSCCEGLLLGQPSVVVEQLDGSSCHGIQAYAGVPLVSPRGFVVGSLSVVDFKPHAFRAEHVDLLNVLSRQAILIFEARKQSRELRAALEVRSRFLATMSHEIRTPLNGIVGAGELLSRTRLDSEQRELLQAICNSGELLLNLVDHVLDVSKLESRSLEISSRPFFLRELLESVVRNFSPLARSKEVRLILEPGDGRSDRVLGDRLRLGQVFNNLVGNALKFTPRGGLISVSAKSTSLAGGWTVRVCDTGIGIAPEFHDRIFTAFEQGSDEISRDYGGTGLGLAISREIVRAMGGEITVESEVGRGSTFLCHLRFEVSPEIPPGLKVLLVEDNPVNQFVARGMLQHLGCEVAVAGNGRLAIEALAGGEHHIVLMDCEMPEMDGFEATRAIRQMRERAFCEIPIIALTARSLVEDWQKCRDCGMNGFVTKPIEIEALKKELLKYSPMRH